MTRMARTKTANMSTRPPSSTIRKPRKPSRSPQPSRAVEPAPVVVIPVRAPAAPAPVRARRPRAAPGAKGKAAFTLRLDPSRHLKLRLACAVTGRSAQQLVTDALDQLLDGMPELDSMAERAPRKTRLRLKHKGGSVMTKSNRLGTALTAVSLIAIVAACAGPDREAAQRLDVRRRGRLRRTSASRPGRRWRWPPTISPSPSRSPSARSSAARRTPASARCSAIAISPPAASPRPKPPTATRSASTPTSRRSSSSWRWSRSRRARTTKPSCCWLEAQGVLDPADAGLALALAGDPQSAVAVLEPAARAVGADARTRQNLALAYAFAGDWDQARTVAAQDVPGRPARRPHPAVDGAGQAGPRFGPGRRLDRHPAGRGRSRPADPPRAEQG